MRINHHKHSAVKPGRPGSELFPDSPLGEQVQGIPTGRDVAWEPLVGAWGRSYPLIWRKCSVLWSLDDEAIYAQSVR